MAISNRSLIRFALAVTLSISLLGSAFAQSPNGETIYFNFLPSITPSERSALSGECDGTTASAEITCRFTQVMIQYQLDPKDLPTETEKRLKQLRMDASKDLNKLTNELCTDIR